MTLLQQRLSALCASLVTVQDYQTLKKAEELVTGLKDVQRALTEVWVNRWFFYTSISFFFSMVFDRLVA